MDEIFVNFITDFIRLLIFLMTYLDRYIRIFIPVLLVRNTYKLLLFFHFVFNKLYISYVDTYVESGERRTHTFAVQPPKSPREICTRGTSYDTSCI